MHGVGEDSKRRWLAYDERGGINTRADEGFNAVEVVLHDTSLARRRPPLLNDYYGFTLAALGDKVRVLIRNLDSSCCFERHSGS